MKEWLIRHFSLISPTTVSKYRYKNNFGKEIDLVNPQEFNEKLQWLKLNVYQRNSKIIQCADKVEVRKYVRECGCEEILTECLGIYDSVDDISWELLPEQFVMKCNHGAGFNIVCLDKEGLDIELAKRKLKKWLKTDYSLPYAELHYHYIKRRIICEKYIKPEQGILPDDYKVYCFDGKAFCIMVCKERINGKCKYYYFNKEWEFLPWDISSANEKNICIEKPRCLKEILEYAERLSKGFPFVRVDFYTTEKKVYFGEMTFTPCGCLDADITEEGNKVLSNKLRLPLNREM